MVCENLLPFRNIGLLLDEFYVENEGWRIVKVLYCFYVAVTAMLTTVILAHFKI